jgi:hypothetical protein
MLYSPQKATNIGVRGLWKGLVNFLDKNAIRKGSTSDLPWSTPPYELFEIKDLFSKYLCNKDCKIKPQCSDNGNIPMNISKKDKFKYLHDDMYVIDIYGPNFPIIVFSLEENIENIQIKDIPTITVENVTNYRYLMGFSLTEQPHIPGCYLYSDDENTGLTRQKVIIDIEKKTLTPK